jgi:hypothetical protein
MWAHEVAGLASVSPWPGRTRSTPGCCARAAEAPPAIPKQVGTYSGTGSTSMVGCSWQEKHLYWTAGKQIGSYTYCRYRKGCWQAARKHIFCEAYP